MLDHPKQTPDARKPRSWNRGKLIGAKLPLHAKHVWAVRTHLQLAGKIRDLALFNLAIDSKLRGCDLVRLRIDDIAPHGHLIDRATVRQRKTGHPVKFELTEQTRDTVAAYLKSAKARLGVYLFPGRFSCDRALSTRQYARLVSE